MSGYTDWLASPLVHRRVTAARGNAGWVRPAWRLDGVNVLRHVSLHGDNVPDAESHILIQDGGAGYDADRNHVELAVGVTNAVAPMVWQSGTDQPVTGVWWVIGEVDLAAAGSATLEVGYHYILETGPSRFNRLIRWVKRSPSYR